MPYENDAPILHICGLWENVSKAGDTYFTGTWGGVKVLILVNKNPLGEKSPTHTMNFQALSKKEKEVKKEDSPRYDTHDPGPDYQEEELPF